MRTLTILAGMMLLLAAEARHGGAAPGGTPAYAIKIKEHPSKDEAFVVHEVEKRKVYTKITNGGKVLKDETEERTTVEGYTETVLQVGKKRPTEYKREYTRAEEKPKGEAARKLSYAGRTVVFSRKDGKFQVSAEGAPALAEADAAALRRQADNAGDEESILPMLPEKPVKVGATWPITSKALAKSGTAGFLIPEKSKGEGKLVKAYTKDGHTWGVVELKLDAAMRGPMGKGELGLARVEITLETPIDGSSVLGKLTMSMKMKGKTVIEQKGMKFDIETDIDQSTTTTRSAKK
jgi:hypothetical protein